MNPLFGEHRIWGNYKFNEGDIVGFAHYSKDLDTNFVKTEKLFLRSKRKPSLLVGNLNAVTRASYSAETIEAKGLSLAISMPT